MKIPLTVVLDCPWCRERIPLPAVLTLTNYQPGSAHNTPRSTMVTVKMPTEHHDCPGPQTEPLTVEASA